MNRSVAWASILVLAALGGFCGWVQLRPEMGGAASPRAWIVEGPPKHLVTPKMAEASRGMTDRPAPSFHLADIRGNMQDLDALRARGPILLTFVKRGCPCSESAQPYFNRLANAYPAASFLAVIDAEAEPARRWAKDHDVAYPMIPDPACNVMRDYAAENSAYVVLIDTRGQIVHHWPGYSAGMLDEVGRNLATRTGERFAPIDVTDAPEDLYSGCPY